MPNAAASFIICIVIGFGLGFAGFEIAGKDDVPTTTTETATNTETNESSVPANNSKQEEPNTAEPETVSANSEILSSKGCLGCHAVSALNLEGGATGPDLSQAFKNVEGKHGKPIDQFLAEPTSAVMSTVIAGNPLSEEEIQKVVTALQEASEK